MKKNIVIVFTALLFFSCELFFNPFLKGSLNEESSSEEISTNESIPEPKIGKIFLANDEWTLSNNGFSHASDTGTFATNVAAWLTNGNPGKFLVYSNNYALVESNLASVMRAAGHTWEASLSIPFNLETLSQYDAIFLSGNVADTSVLTAYVNAGGSVYLTGGALAGGSASAEAAIWNPFLNNFGLGFATYYNYSMGGSGNYPVNSTHPAFKGVEYLYNFDGSDTIDTSPSDPASAVIVTYNGHGLYAIYDPSLAE